MESSIVHLPEGKVRGTVRTDAKGEEFNVFLSIPYAKPPVGNLRFKAPVPVEPWEGIRDAVKQGDSCIQEGITTAGAGITGSEDCLTLHICTKKLPKEEQKLKLVMVWIHGGAFVLGSNDINMSGPEYLMTEDIVLVIIQYRLGLLGFLSLHDTSLDVPGNAGLKDQVQALKWVQKNIKQFNGDPDNVTIFGESAGGASVEYLLLSPSAKNLFHRAIMQSGSSLNPWARGKFDPADFAAYLGHPNLTEQEILKLLTDMSALDLYRAQMKYHEEIFDNNFGLIAPTIEKPNPIAFITRNPIDIIQSGDYNAVPIITGYCDNEGLLIALIDNLNKLLGKPPRPEKKDAFNQLLPVDTNMKDLDHVMEISLKIKEFYNREEYRNRPFLLETDAIFVIGIIAAARNLAKFSKNPVYLYRFSFDGQLNFGKKMGQLHDYEGACHGDDLGYLWKSSQSPAEIESTTKRVQQRILKMWINFAKEGNPTPTTEDEGVEWKPIDGETINFLDIGEELIPDVNPEADRVKFWKEIFQMNPVTAKLL